MIEPEDHVDPALVRALADAGFDTSSLSPFLVRLTIARLVRELRDLHDSIHEPRFGRP